MTAYRDIKDLYLAGQTAEAGRLVEAHRQALGSDGAGCTLAGVVMMALGRPEAAVPWLDAAARHEPASPQVWSNLSAALEGCGLLAEARASLARAVSLEEAEEPGWLGYARTALRLGGLSDALGYLTRALHRDSEDLDALALLGLVLHRLGRWEDALAAYDQVVTLRADDAETWLNRGVLLHEAGRVEAALASYDAALALNAQRADAWSNRAKALCDLHRLEEAVAAFTQALALRPEDPVLLVDRGMCRLLAGDYAAGFADYEARLQGAEPPRPSGCPTWQGEDLAGKRLLVSAEQGFGDTFQFVRFLSALAAQGARVTFQVPVTLHPLLAPLTEHCTLVGEGEGEGPYDYHVSLLSLPHRLGLRAGSLGAAPYLRVGVEGIARWAGVIGERGFRVGIAWQGNPQFRHDSRRSIPLAHFLTLAGLPGVRLISLQRGPGLDQLKAVPASLVERLPEPLDTEGAFLDTAAVLMSLDLVVTSDSAVAHLAGALGRPVWLALSHVPDWRWLLTGEDCPWYPSLRLFRQERPGDWASVFAAIHAALARRAAGIVSGPVSLPMVPCSLGELIDKISILQIKSERIHDPDKLRYVRDELKLLTATPAFETASTETRAVLELLRDVNGALWQVEDELRSREAEGRFDADFVEAARSVYRLNDRRAALKRRIDVAAGSLLREQKSYALPDPATLRSV
ncbi:tetratricopeptide repeat-containing glycosyltransferase family protein [Methylobacterium organophilum]|uniref:DUF6165 family protein n=1 Tax=Methylobacterium organophilum TaxID=410 RepID=UPI001F129EA0|nr:DUF6165 family protein [Methylobacterium organophilum]UMY19802.1 tetratricopeptide repeat-containing glycosyltransferase family protein [Methylobacterium organophilum]